MEYNLTQVEEFIKLNTDKALELSSKILGKEINNQSFNGIIGGKNGTYKVDPSSFDTADEYYKEWLKSHNELFENDKNYAYERSVHKIHRLLHNSFLAEYIKFYLIRTYLRKH